MIDPTCGSGAFLFSALNILEPLYDACIDKMYDFKHEKPDLYVEFDSILEDIEKHPNREYFIYKSIILNNLYGVDIMKEATEIAKLRLFLKLASCAEVDYKKENLGLEALPDIDFNIRAGNSLVGFANYQEIKDTVDFDGINGQRALNFDDPMKQIDEKAQLVALAYKRFKDSQLVSGSHKDIVSSKKDLQIRLESLNDELNHYMAKKYGIDIEKEKKYEKWLNTHEPFNWFVEFYDVIHNRGGFDVIIGNPPYVIYTKKDKTTKKSTADVYKLINYKTIEADNLYVFTIERSLKILNNKKILGMIVPLSILCATNMNVVRELLSYDLNTYYSSYEIRPAKLFDGVDQRLTIFLSFKSISPKIYSTKINRWASEHREYLFKSLFYTETVNDERIWRFDNEMDYKIYKKIQNHTPVKKYLARSRYNLHYRSAGLRYWIIFLNDGFGTVSASNRQKSFDSKETSKFYMAVLNSNLYWWFYSVNFDMFNLTDSNIFDFPCNYDEKLNLISIATKLEEDLNNNKHRLITNKRNGEVNKSYAFQKKKSKPIIDEIDKILAKHYGFTDEELDYIINYDIKYRMGDSLNDDDNDE